MKVSRRLMILNGYGMYARPAGAFVRICSKIGPNTTVTVRKEEQESDGKSIRGLLLLEIDQGQTITVTAEGPEADQVVRALHELVNKGFHQGDDCLPVPPGQELDSPVEGCS